MRILYVEDEPSDAALARRELARHAPCAVMDVAATLAEARACLATNAAYDVVLADLRLPDGSGLDLLAETRARALPLAVVILTSYGDEATAVAALKAGAADYLQKREGYLARLPLALESALASFRSETARRAGILRVLYAEHHATDIDLTRRHLAAHAPHIRLDVVHSSREVLARLPRAGGEPCPWDVLLLDYRLPGESALDVLKVVRDERGLDLPVVLVTGQGDEDVAAHALRLGAADYLNKHPNYLYELPPALENAHHRARLVREHATLRESEARYRDLVENSQDMICTHDLDGNLLSVNDAAIRMSGYTRDEIRRMNLADLLDPDVRSGLGAFLAEIRTTGQARGIMRVRTAGGETRYWDYDSSLRTEGVAAPVVRGMARDVTARVLAERALREAQERLQRAVSAANVGLWELDLRTSQVYYSAEWKRQIGYADDEIPSALDEWQRRLHPDDRDRTLQSLQAFLANPGPNFEHEFRLRHKDGSYRHILAQSSLLRDDQGQPVRLVGSHVDISERKQLEARFLQAQKMESVGRLAGGIAHDFNNLLTVINGTADLALVDLRDDDPLRADLTEIRRAGERAAVLTRQLLAFGRRQILQPEVLDLNAVVADMRSMLQRLISEDIELVIMPAERPGFVRADTGQIEQVVVNLAVNARDAMPDGGKLTIETRDVQLDEAHAARLSAAPPGPYVMLTVSDTGAGIDEATRERIFEPFFTTKDTGKGTGLGLSTVYGIVGQSGGRIAVESDVGKGSTFTVYLPRVEKAAFLDRPAAAATATRGTETILVVEDEEAVCRLATRFLESAGYTVLAATSGAEALLRLERHDGPVHLTITDVVMPGMSGRELATRLQQVHPGMCVLYASGYTDDAILRHGVLDDATHFVSKPYTRDELTRKVREALTARR